MRPITPKVVDKVIQSADLMSSIVRGTGRNLTEILWRLERKLQQMNCIPDDNDYPGSGLAYHAMKALADFFWPNIELSDRYSGGTRGFKIRHSFSIRRGKYNDFCHVITQAMNQAYDLDPADDHSHPMPWRKEEEIAQCVTDMDSIVASDYVYFDYAAPLGNHTLTKASGVVSKTSLFLFTCEGHKYGYHKHCIKNLYKMDFAQHRIDQRNIHRLVQLQLTLKSLPFVVVYHVFNFNQKELHSSVFNQAEKKYKRIQGKINLGRQRQKHLLQQQSMVTASLC